MPKISVIIVTYNAMKWAEKCFSSLRSSSFPLDCIVIDNGSSDGTQDFLRNNFPEVDFIQSTKNLGFGKANNIGIEKAYKNGADFFYLMNQDAWLHENSIQCLLDVYESYDDKKEIGILSPMQTDGSEKYLDIFLDKYIAINFEKTRLISDLYFQTLKCCYEISFVNAAHWLIPRETIVTVGGFNPYFFHYGEDNEYVNRVHYHKKKVLLVPSSKVVHDGKQFLDKVNTSLHEDLTIETKILNPNITYSLKNEKKALRQSIVKNMFSGNNTNVQKLRKKYCKILNEEKKLSQLLHQTKQKGLTFLNIS
ncbi:glycosyl transferase family 2 [Chryseobacterium sp. Leaf404]|uniref:glycosyltransferase family 2 protein n=1 Tax=unclassified Chryseobacterium TaxID=2593645 RepID=UPI00070087C6|nr:MULTISPECIES: glycosyltransferase family 2 protein [unclassified Chryseobacterium]KQT15511.1 glycosyl transferase family 2 [Chryseobacterium sp. Leaf404]